MLPLNTSKRVRWKWTSTLLLLSFLFSTLNSQSTEVKTKKILICEGELARLECGESEQIDVELANFGRFAFSPCNLEKNPDFVVNCVNNATNVVLANRCDGKNSCEFVVGATIFGDTCPGTSKYLDAKYSCVHVTTTVAPPTQSPPIADGTHLPAPNNSKTPNNDVKYSIENDHPKSENCPAISYRLIQWPETQPSHLSKGKCPSGSHGDAHRRCLSNGQWELGSDLSGCVSTAFRNLQNDFRQTWESDFLVPVEFVEDVQKFVRTDKLLAGDLIQLSHLLYKINFHNEKYAYAYNRPQLAEIAKLTIRIVNEILQISQRDSWFDLLPDEQSRVALRFIHTVQRTLRNVARSTTSSQTLAEMFVSRPGILGVAAMAKSQQTVELPVSSSYEIEDRVLFSLSDSELGREYEIAYASISELGQFLMRTQNSNECDRTLLSKVLSTWSGVRSLVPHEEEMPLVLSFSTRKPDSSLRVRCVKWSDEQKGFLEDGSCMVLVHNSTQTICRCMGTGLYAVVGSNCDSQLFSGLNKETIALLISCILVIFGMFIYLIGLSVVNQNQPKYTFIRRNFCATLILSEFLLCIWFLLPRHGVWSSILLYILHGLIFTIAWWILIQMFQLFYSLLQLINQRQIGSHSLHYIIGYSVPIILIFTIIASSGNISLFLRGFQPLQKPSDLLITGPLVLLMLIHLLFAVFAFYLLVKRFRVGYIPCRTDADTLSAVRSLLIHLSTLIVAIDAFCFMATQFSLHPISVWLWLLVGVNVLQFLMTLRVLSFKRLCSGCFFSNDEKKPLRANDLPKNAIFSPAVQNNTQNFNFPYNDPAYMKNQGSSVGAFSEGQPQIYVPTNGVHLPHDCHCEYATIPPDYYSFYNNQHYRIYQQNPANPSQLQRSMANLPPVPPIPISGFCRPNDHQIMYNLQGMADDQMPVCNDHGPGCSSLASLRLSNSQLYNNHHPPHQTTDNSYETARSSSTSGTNSSVASSGTFLLIDPKKNYPIFLNENA